MVISGGVPARVVLRLSVLFTVLSAACSVDRATSPTPPDFAVHPNQTCNPDLGDCGGGGGGGGGGGSGGGGGTTDPDSSAPGYWLGVNTGPSRCYSATGGGINDVDHDHFDEWCETLIAQRFAPLLRFSPYDCNVGMEPRWAANYFPSQQVVRVGYLLSYYLDCGQEASLCAWSQPFVAQNDCLGHEGDSEFVIVDIVWDESTQHWKANRAFLSAHFDESDGFLGFGGDFSTLASWSSLEFPEKSRGYIKAWVAEGKHGNYRTQSDCNAGGAGGADDCTRHTGQYLASRVAVLNNRNVGSPTVHLIDCTQAAGIEAPFRPGTECYWTSPRFQGWYVESGGSVSVANSATGYGVKTLPLVMQTYKFPPECPLTWPSCS